jgi:hypothetical protein
MASPRKRRRGADEPVVVPTPSRDQNEVALEIIKLVDEMEGSPAPTGERMNDIERQLAKLQEEWCQLLRQ